MKSYRIPLCILISTSFSAYSMEEPDFKIPDAMACTLVSDAQLVDFYLPGDMWRRIVSASRRNPLMHVCKFLWQFASRYKEETLLIDPSFTYLSLEDATRLLARSVEHNKTAQVTSLLYYIKQKYGVNPVKLTRMEMPIPAYAKNEEMIALLQKFHKKTLTKQKTYLSQPIISAARTGKTKIIMQELDSALSRKEQNTEDLAILIHHAAGHAASEGHTSCLQPLLEHIADHEEKQKLLKHTVSNGNLACTELLLNTWSYTDKQDGDGKKSQQKSLAQPFLEIYLEYAVSMGQTNMVRMLLQHGADQIRPNIGAGYPLHGAYAHNHGDIIQLLLDDLTETTRILEQSKQESLIARAFIYLLLKIVQHPEHSCLASSAKLYGACVLGNIEYIRNALTTDVTLDQLLFPHARALLHVAAASNQKELVSFLIAQKHIIDSVDKLGRTPLMFAAMSGNLSIVEMLHKAGGNINAKASDGNTCLMAAAKHNHLPIVKYLISHNADLNARNNQGMSPLHCAATSKGTEQIIEYLVTQGMDINGTTVNNPRAKATALEFAATYNNLSVARKLIELGADLTINNHNAIRNACAQNLIKIIKLFLGAYEKSGIHLRDHANNLSNWVMPVSIENNHVETVQLLLDAGAPITDMWIQFAHDISEEIEELLRKTRKEREKASS